ncbi:MAG TPA: trigger factor [Patescibacteria group bacterium]|jgi:trigger factor|nr:trigger factor [Patescibacteria group bacterium]
MKVNRKNISDTKVELKVVADKAVLDTVKSETLKTLSKNVTVSGFRAGKAPAHLVEKNIDSALLQREFLDNAINRVYQEVVRDEDLHPVDQPTVNITKFVPFSDLELTIEVDVMGQIELPDYKNIKLKKTEVKISASDVDEVLNQLQARQAKRKPVTRKSQLGDEVIIDFDGTDAKTNQPIPGAKSSNYQLILGSKSFIPGFEEHLVGLKPTENLDFIITFPQDYGAEFLRNKRVKFIVKLHKINELDRPELNDKFAAEIGPFKSLADLKADIKKQITSERELQSLRQYQNELVGLVVERSKVALPDSLIQQEADRVEQDEKQRLIYEGKTWEEHLSDEGIDEANHRSRVIKQAGDRLRAGVIIGEVSRAEGVTVTKEELEARIKLLKGQYNDAQMQAELDKPENQQDVANRILTEKTIDRLAGYASKAN